MHKHKYLKSISAGLNKKKIILKNLSNRPLLINITSQNIDKLRQSGRNLKTPYIDYNKRNISKEKGKINKKYNQFNNLQMLYN